MATQALAGAAARSNPLPFTGRCPDAPRLAAIQLAKVLAGMIGRGHGIEALCFFLQLTREALLNLVVEHGLHTPHDRPRRKSGGARAWTAADYSLLITGWTANWRAASIGEALGRSPGSVWAQARRLALPPRDRKSLVKPADGELRHQVLAERSDRRVGSAISLAAKSTGEAVTVPARAPAACRTEAGQAERAEAASAPASSASAVLRTCASATAATDAISAIRIPAIAAAPATDELALCCGTAAPAPPPPVATPAIIRACGTAAKADAVVETPARSQAWLVRNAVTPVWVRLKPGSDDIDWDQALDDEVANRFWAYQHPRAAAKDFGIRFKTLVSRHTRLELPPGERDPSSFRRDRARLVEHYDPSVIAANVAEARYVKRECLSLKGWWFWGPRSKGASYSKRSRRITEFADIRKYAGAIASVALAGGNFSCAY